METHNTSMNLTAEAPSSNKDSSNDLEQLLKDIEECDFVSIDLEYSGLFVQSPPRTSLEEYFKTCVESASTFLAVQFGVCTAKQDKCNPNLWELSPYNFYSLPSGRHIGSVDTNVLQWLYKNNFSFSKWLTDGCDYYRLSEMPHLQLKKGEKYAKLYEKLNSNGLQRIIQVVVEREKPLIVHNGHMDMLHVYDKFVGELPATIEEFSAELLRLFTGGIFDTKHLAHEGLHTVLGLGGSQGTNLFDLRTHLLYKHHYTHFKIPEHRVSCNYSATYSLKEEAVCSHEAGFDAFVTAQIFILELELYTRPYEPHVTKRKRRKLPVVNSPPFIPFDWGESGVCDRFKNFIAVSSISPGFINLKAYATSNDSLSDLQP